MRLLTLIGLATCLVLGACATVESSPGRLAGSPFMPAGAAIDAPVGYTAMCRDRASLCIDHPPATVVALVDRRDGRSRGPNDARPSAIVSGSDLPLNAFNSLAHVAPWEQAQPNDHPRLMRVSWSDEPVGGGLSWPGQVNAAAPLYGQRPSPNDLFNSEGDNQPTARSSLADRLRLLEMVNRHVNSNVTQRTDIEVYGFDDYWTRAGDGPGAVGDCKHIAIEKRIELVEQGFPPHDLFYAIAYRSDMGLHAVLIAHTEAGDLVLDSRESRIVAWNKAPYNWVKRQSQEDPSLWALVDLVRPAATELRVASLEQKGVERQETNLR